MVLVDPLLNQSTFLTAPFKDVPFILKLFFLPMDYGAFYLIFSTHGGGGTYLKILRTKKFLSQTWSGQYSKMRFFKALSQNMVRTSPYVLIYVPAPLNQVLKRVVNRTLYGRGWDFFSKFIIYLNYVCADSTRSLHSF